MSKRKRMTQSQTQELARRLARFTEIYPQFRHPGVLAGISGWDRISIQNWIGEFYDVPLEEPSQKGKKSWHTEVLEDLLSKYQEGFSDYPETLLSNILWVRAARQGDTEDNPLETLHHPLM